MAELAGLVLAAGAGTRFGGPKALASAASGEPWITRSVSLLRAAGCDSVLVVLGAEAAAARALVPSGADVVVAPEWRQGLGASLAAGFAALPEADAVLVTLVDLPDLPAAVAARVLQQGTVRSALARAAYAGRPGHPVLVGRDHWSAFAASLRGDEGGRRYLRLHGVAAIECGDLFTGEDVDHRTDRG